MSGKSVETAIRDLTKTVLSMENRIVLLEKVIVDQNKLIKKLVSDNEDSSASAKSIKISEDEGRSAPQLTQRPMREARVRAVSALTVAARKTKGAHNTSPTPSVHVISPEPMASSSQSAPHSPTALAMPQLVNSAAVSHAQSNKVNNNAPDWVEVKPRRSFRAPSNVTRGTAIPGSTVCPLLAADRKSYLHLYFVMLGTTAEQVVAHMRKICPDDLTCTAEVLKSRGEYASFKLTVSAKNVEIYLKPEHWAEDVYIKPWRSGFRNPQQQEGQ